MTFRLPILYLSLFLFCLTQVSSVKAQSSNSLDSVPTSIKVLDFASKEGLKYSVKTELAHLENRYSLLQQARTQVRNKLKEKNQQIIFSDEIENKLQSYIKSQPELEKMVKEGGKAAEREIINGLRQELTRMSLDSYNKTLFMIDRQLKETEVQIIELKRKLKDLRIKIGAYQAELLLSDPALLEGFLNAEKPSVYLTAADVSGVWSNGSFIITEVYLNKKYRQRLEDKEIVGCDPQVFAALERMKNQRMSMSMNVTLNEQGVGSLTTTITPPGATQKSNPSKPISCRYSNGSLVAVKSEKQITVRMEGAVVEVVNKDKYVIVKDPFNSESGPAEWTITVFEKGAKVGYIKGTWTVSKSKTGS
ncbi:hypothetical protein Pan241w_32970 [Gimesia alba]|uniref:SH3b domain-containing protein n=1 Tax=Gimesia alba TaxID=2527973 RepID=A0A517RH40_9PLAN|nr:hypothetical protein [Gimesia alba]QDT43197.1 hypothetical protein Pan241w_32970 [Gimesia alba]